MTVHLLTLNKIIGYIAIIDRDKSIRNEITPQGSLCCQNDR